MRAKAATLGLLVAGLAVLVAVTGVPTAEEVRRALDTAPGWAPVATVLGVAVLSLALFPRAAVAVLAGTVFTPVEATAYVVAGTVLGGSAAFGVGRLLGREYLQRRARGRLEALDTRLGRHGFLAVVVARLLPVVPAGAAHYGFGVTTVRYRSFAAGTAVGILPTTSLYVTVGAAADNPTSPAFLASVALAAVAALGGLLAARWLRRKG